MTEELWVKAASVILVVLHVTIELVGGNGRRILGWPFSPDIASGLGLGYKLKEMVWLVALYVMASEVW